MKRAILVGALAVAVVACLLWGARTGSDAAGAAAPSQVLRLALPRGTEIRYELEIAAVTTYAPQGLGERMEGEMDLAGALTLRSHGERAGAFRVAASLSDLSRHHHRVLGAETLPDAAKVAETFAGRAAWLEVEPSGRIRSVRFEPADPPLFKHLMQLVVSQLGLSLDGAAGAGWSAEEPGPSGTARVRYAAEEAGDGFALSREREAYTTLSVLPDAGATTQTLAHRGAAVIGASGHVTELRDDEELRVSGGAELTSRFRFELREIASEQVELASVDVARLQPIGARDVRGASEMEQVALTQLAGSLTFAEVERTLARHVDGVPLESGWLSRAAALLQLEPEQIERIEELLLSGELGAGGEALALDLLAAAGTPRAQAAMRAALAGAGGDDRRGALLIQRLAFVKEPDAETVAYLAGAHAGAEAPHLWRASAQALGSAAGRLAGAGDLPAARAQAETLAAELEGAVDADDRAALIAALGNAGLPEHVERIAALAADEAPEVRSAAAVALRKTDSPAARAALLALASDAEPRVARAAIDTLGRHGLTGGDLEEICALIVEGRTPVLADGAMLMFLSSRAGEPVERALEAILARTQDPRLAAQARALLRAEP
jgi:hypothetical protein